MRDKGGDAALLARLQPAEKAALAEVAEKYSAKIYQLAFRYLKNKEDAEEVTQDVLYKVHRKVAEFRGDAALSSWIYRITFNTAMSRLRTAHHQTLRHDEAPASKSGDEEMTGAPLARDIPDWSDMADEHVLRSQLRRRLLRAIRALPAVYRAPVVLRDLIGLSTEEASRVLHVKDQTLKSRLHRGRLILRRQLADFAGGLSLHHAYGT